MAINNYSHLFDNIHGIVHYLIQTEMVRKFNGIIVFTIKHVPDVKLKFNII